jgi:hypothetical protein
MVQVAVPELSVVVEDEQMLAPPVTVQVMFPVGMPPGPVTVAMKTRLPPVDTEAELSVTVVEDPALLTLTELSGPDDGR